MLIRNGQIHDAVHAAGYVADLRVTDGKIAAIAPGLAPEPGEEVVDATGLWVYPGLVEAHCHTAMDTLFTDELDKNEKSAPIMPMVRAIDSFNPQDAALPLARAAGVTTLCVGPGSSNVVGGTFMAVKTVGTCVDEMVVKNPVAMKCAFGGNPKGVHAKKGCETRMGVAARLRETLFAAREYYENKQAGAKQKFDLGMEAFIPVLKKEIPLKVHVQREDDICTVLRIAKEFDLRVTLEHCHTAWGVIDKIAAAGVRVAVGPHPGSSWTATEIRGKNAAIAGAMDRAGIPVSIMTDSYVVQQHYLLLCAEACIRAGMEPFHALQAITINAARHAEVGDRVGSLEVGKDADFVLWTGDLFRYTSKIRAVYIDGKKVAGE